jgi:hypothetical protein
MTPRRFAAPSLAACKPSASALKLQWHASYRQNAGTFVGAADLLPSFSSPAHTYPYRKIAWSSPKSFGANGTAFLKMVSQLVRMQVSGISTRLSLQWVPRGSYNVTKSVPFSFHLPLGLSHQGGFTTLRVHDLAAEAKSPANANASQRAPSSAPTHTTIDPTPSRN